jgi:hypothetical protein
MKILNERAVLSLIKRGERIIFLQGARLTSAAKDPAHQHEVKISEELNSCASAPHAARPWWGRIMGVGNCRKHCLTAFDFKVKMAC